MMKLCYACKFRRELHFQIIHPDFENKKLSGPFPLVFYKIFTNFNKSVPSYIILLERVHTSKFDLPYFLGTYQYNPWKHSFGEIPMYIFTLYLALQITFVFWASVLAFKKFNSCSGFAGEACLETGYPEKICHHDVRRTKTPPPFMSAQFSFWSFFHTLDPDFFHVVLNFS